MYKTCSLGLHEFCVGFLVNISHRLFFKYRNVSNLLLLVPNELILKSTLVWFSYNITARIDWEKKKIRFASWHTHIPQFNGEVAWHSTNHFHLLQCNLVLYSSHHLQLPNFNCNSQFSIVPQSERLWNLNIDSVYYNERKWGRTITWIYNCHSQSKQTQ